MYTNTIHNIRFIRWRVQLMEKGVNQVDFTYTDSMIQAHDYKGASMFGRTANTKEATNTIIKLMQDNYPEFLVSCPGFHFCVNISLIIIIYIVK
jgi:hypothetical protein